MANYDEYMRRYFESAQYQQMAGMGLLGGLSDGVANSYQQWTVDQKAVEKTEPEFNPVLLLGDDDEA